MVTVNLSQGKDYFTQRNNRIDPNGTCGPTSLIMALLYSGYELPDCGGRQPEDVLTEFIRTNREVMEYYKKMYPIEFGKNVPANELAPVRAFGTNRWMNKEVNRFAWTARIQEIVFSIKEKKACVVSGQWPYRAGGVEKTIGHIVCVCGFQTAQEDIGNIKDALQVDSTSIISLIIDDPYGDYRTGYVDARGNDVIVPYKDFLKIVKEPGQNRKWVHFIV